MVDKRQPTFLAVIPARGGSKGISKKNIKLFCEEPLISWSIRQALQAGASNVLVSTDDPLIASISKDYGAEVVDRPMALAGDEASSEEALVHALTQFEVSDDAVVVFLQATSPVRKPEFILEMAEIVRLGRADSAFSSNRVDDLTVWRRDKDALVSVPTQAESGRLPRQLRNPVFVENGSMYSFRAGTFLSAQSRLFGRIEQVVLPKWTIHELDDLDDWEIMETLMRKFVLPEKGVT